MADQEAPRAPLPFMWGVLYAPPNPENAPKMCVNCIMWSYEDQKCSIHAASLNVPAEGICGYHVYGPPSEYRVEHDGMVPVTKENSGFEIVPEGTFCGSCTFYEPTEESKGVCHGVAKADGKPPQPVDVMACCARWESPKP